MAYRFYCWQNEVYIRSKVLTSGSTYQVKASSTIPREAMTTQIQTQ
jgi:hypothetical protein